MRNSCLICMLTLHWFDMMLVVGESRYMFYRNWKLAAMACSIIPVSNCALKVRCSRLTETDTVHVGSRS